MGADRYVKVATLHLPLPVTHFVQIVSGITAVWKDAQIRVGVEDNAPEIWIPEGEVK